jgi:hypothetical protein
LTHEQVVALGVAADAQWHSGQVIDGEQRWTYTAKRPLSAGMCERCMKVGVGRRAGFCSLHPLAGRRADLTLAQLEDLARAAGDAGDHVAYLTIRLATAPGRLGWQPTEIELHAMAHAIDAWVGRCRRTGGRPWTRSFNDPKAERPCPGCEACAGDREATPATTAA